jgi:ATP-binding cassette subfamily B protein
VPLPPDQEECPACSSENLTAPSTWTLFRLWRFAKPYKGQLLAGFLLTLASTAATLVPPYLTMPLMDDILLPYQSGQPIDQQLTIFYLAALFFAALLAWALGWAKTYILALVSERIGADLRTKTYEHLMKLSLEYFGGKRTGDLMARIGSESDRICLFLSLHLLDFATDVLMILMTAVILVSLVGLFMWCVTNYDLALRRLIESGLRLPAFWLIRFRGFELLKHLLKKSVRPIVFAWLINIT